MSATSKIEWTDATWNPVRGCKKVSPGCKHCYAEVFAERFRGVPGHPYQQGFDVRLVPEKLTEPFRWPRPRMVFVNLMSDLFQDDVPDDYIVGVATVMQRANWHTYQVLTKRSERMAKLLRGKLAFAARLPHIWWASAWKIGGTAFRESSIFRTLPHFVGFFPWSPYWSISGESSAAALIGRLLAAKAEREHEPWSTSGSNPSMPSVGRPTYRSSSSNGAEGRRQRPAGHSMAGPTMKCHR
jgi:protein gp37